MNKQDFAIATITWARDQGEEQLLRKSLSKLAELEIPVFVTDGGSSPGFLQFLTGFPHFNLSTTTARGVWPQAKNSLLQASQSGTNFIFYTEPDKYDFFCKLPGIVRELLVDKQTGIVMASRSGVGFATFPDFQQMTETTINNCCKEVVGKAVDYTYGPFLLNSQLVPLLQTLPEDIGWGWRPYTFGIAKQLGLAIDALVADFMCPLDQREDSPKERIYRMRQLDQNIQGIVLSEFPTISDRLSVGIWPSAV
ncbi:MAG: hypothetical protein JWQ96_1189 [Segetibacter sp.]|nr:hypothetical protein [Segetibacter sp.]